MDHFNCGSTAWVVFHHTKSDYLIREASRFAGSDWEIRHAKLPSPKLRRDPRTAGDSFHSVTSHFRRRVGRRFHKRVLSPQGATSGARHLVLYAAEGMAIARELAQPDERNLSQPLLRR